MGLDMYLYKKHYIGNYYKQPEDQVKIQVPNIKQERVSEITEKIAQWRKANAIHGWFTRNIDTDYQNGDERYVSRDQLHELIDICDKVLAGSKLVEGKIKNGQKMENGKWKDVLIDGKYIDDTTIAEKLLPTEDGFFFGGTDYDQYYIVSLKETKKQIEAVLSEPENGDFYYSANW